MQIETLGPQTDEDIAWTIEMLQVCILAHDACCAEFRRTGDEGAKEDMIEFQSLLRILAENRIDFDPLVPRQSRGGGSRVGATFERRRLGR